MSTSLISLSTRSPRLQSGVSLIIVLIMLVIIGLTSAAAIRNATSGEKATNNIRLQNLAQQYAEAALRYCETEVAKADATRAQNTLKNANIFNDDGNGFAKPTDLTGAGLPLGNYPPLGWTLPNTWTTAGGGASASKTVVPAAQVTSGDSAFTPAYLPQCVVERSQMPDGKTATVITARGFSPDYTRKDAATELTVSGSVVWLQSTSLIN